jgi:rhamnose utilization protein RhaD (predicted bifunctional aldolase and dehydrogenase)
MSIEQIIPLADRWSETEAAGRSELDLLVYQSRLLGSDPHLVLWGGGNTSFKREEQDYRGRTCPVLRVKGSGSDLRVVEPRDFPAVRLDDVLALFEREEMSDEAMVEYLRFALLDPGAPRPSIETLLHAFVPARSVVHTHADAILALTNNVRASILLKEVFGDDVALIPYLRPGFQLSKLVGQTARTRPALQGIILLNHGLITWHDDPCVAYRLHLELVNRAACYGQEATRSVHPGFALPAPSRRQEIAARLAPLLRGLLSQQQPLVARFDESAAVLRFVSGAALGAQRTRAVLQEGAATPDHILNVKRTPLWIDRPALTMRRSWNRPRATLLRDILRSTRPMWRVIGRMSRCWHPSRGLCWWRDWACLPWARIAGRQASAPILRTTPLPLWSAQNRAGRTVHCRHRRRSAPNTGPWNSTSYNWRRLKSCSVGVLLW